jgi:fused signal recognition particle receptor
MGVFWRRKAKDQFLTLGLNEPKVAKPAAQEDALLQPASVEQNSPAPSAVEHSTVDPFVSGGKLTPFLAETEVAIAAAKRTAPPGAPDVQRKSGPEQKPFTPRAPFATSILGLNLSIEELQAQEAALEQEFSTRFRRAVAATRESLTERLDAVFQGLKQIDENLLDQLEEALIAADIGVATTQHILETVRRGIARKQINDLDALKAAIKNELLRILRASENQGIASETSVPDDVLPYVMMIVGVNGVGKTTTIGKLAQRIKAEGNDVLICAADTFRAAASDQLAIWAERTGVPLIQQKQGTDPAAVLFDSLKAAKARGSDVLIVDTAGRLHNKSNLMAELEKMKRVAGREVQGAPHETLLVVDAVTGQNGLEQARQFLKVAGVTGIVLTKLDGTAKGGIAVAIANELNLPIRYAGIGEKVDDLVVFDPELYVNGLFN